MIHYGQKLAKGERHLIRFSPPGTIHDCTILDVSPSGGYVKLSGHGWVAMHDIRSVERMDSALPTTEGTKP